jgi:hypothetical protein
MIAYQPPTVKQEATCHPGFADVSSTVGSVTIAVKPDAGLVVKKEIIISGVRLLASETAVVSTGDRRKPQPTRYAVIRGRRNLSLEPEQEPRTRVIESGISFGQPRIGFTTLKR